MDGWSSRSLSCNLRNILQRSTLDAFARQNTLLRHNCGKHLREHCYHFVSFVRRRLRRRIYFLVVTRLAFHLQCSRVTLTMHEATWRIYCQSRFRSLQYKRQLPSSLPNSRQRVNCRSLRQHACVLHLRTDPTKLHLVLPIQNVAVSHALHRGSETMLYFALVVGPCRSPSRILVRSCPRAERCVRVLVPHSDILAYSALLVRSMHWYRNQTTVREVRRTGCRCSCAHTALLRRSRCKCALL